MTYLDNVEDANLKLCSTCSKNKIPIDQEYCRDCMLENIDIESPLSRNKKSLWSRFWNWYNKQMTYNIVFMAVIIYLQLPHMLWVADLLFEAKIGLSGISDITDFMLYGIDLIEILAMIKIGMMIYGRITQRSRNENIPN